MTFRAPPCISSGVQEIFCFLKSIMLPPSWSYMWALSKQVSHLNSVNIHCILFTSAYPIYCSVVDCTFLIFFLGPNIFLGALYWYTCVRTLFIKARNHFPYPCEISNGCIVLPFRQGTLSRAFFTLFILCRWMYIMHWLYPIFVYGRKFGPSDKIKKTTSLEMEFFGRTAEDTLFDHKTS